MKRHFVNYEKCAEKVLGEVVKKGGEHKFVIYPFGKEGKLVKSILNVYYNINEYMIVDNFLCNKYTGISNLQMLSQEDLADIVVLVSSDNINIYDQIRENLYSVVPKEQCIEIFAKSGCYADICVDEDKISSQMQYIAMRHSAEYVMKHMLNTARIFENRYEQLEYVLCEAVDNSLGLFLEFGVFKGETINFISTFQPMDMVYGFDCFE